MAASLHEARARAVKVSGLILALQKFSAYVNRPVLARDVLGWRDESWNLLAMIADVNPPSIETRRLVLDELIKRDEAVAKHNAETRAGR
jgi:hypothetical protein